MSTRTPRSWGHTIRRLSVTAPYCSAITREPGRSRGCIKAAEYGCSYRFRAGFVAERKAERSYCAHHAQRFAERWCLIWPPDAE